MADTLGLATTSILGMNQAPILTGGRVVDSALGLCNICKEVDFRYIRLRIEEKKGTDGRVEFSVREEKHHLGYLDEIFQTTECTLCRLVMKAMDLSWPELPRYTLAGEKIRCYINSSDYTHSSQQKSENGSRRRNWELKIELDMLDVTKDLGRRSRSLYHSALRLDEKHVSTLSHPDGLYNLGRVYGEAQVDLDFLKKCYENCKMNHGPGCEMLHSDFNIKVKRFGSRRDTNSLKPPQSLRLIDVNAYRVVEASPDSEWMALSYCWGKAPFLKLTRGNYDALTGPEGLRQCELPRTLRESISLVAHPGERYLWIDSLCILQDDENDKLAQILQMDRIFGHASVTIVAGGGTDVEAGLPGYVPNSRHAQQYSGEVHGLRFIAMRPPLSVVLKTLYWNSRAWTYQEFWLSKRLLVFAPEQVFFVCAAEPVQEDSVHYTPEYAQWYLNDGEKMRIAKLMDSDFTQYPWRMPYGGHRPHNRGFLDWRAMKDLGSAKAYRDLVKNYSSRNMTNHGDILAAIHGVLQSVAPLKHDFYFCGLQESGFDWALLWQPMGPIVRRAPLPPLNKEIPSWSWAGWVGPIGYRHLGSFSCRRTISTWTFCLPTGETTELISEVERDSFPPEDLKAVFEEKREKVLTERPEIFTSSKTIVDTGYLYFTTYSARFNVDTRHDPRNGFLLYSIESFGPSFQQDIALFRIHHKGTNDSWIGSVVLELSFAKQFQNTLVDTEFIIISDTTSSASGLAYDEERREWVAVESFDRERWGLRRDPTGESMPALMYNVMWIRREGRVTQRVAVGQIHVDTWNKACLDKEEELICLG